MWAYKSAHTEELARNIEPTMPMPMTLGSFDHSAAQRLNNLYRREQLSRDFAFSRGSTGSSRTSVQSSPEMFVENGIEYPLGMLDSANPAISGDLTNGSKILANQPKTSKLLPAFRNRPDELSPQPITTSSIPDCTFAARDSRYYPSGAGSVVLQRISPSHSQQPSPIQSVGGQDHQANHSVQLTSSLRSTLGIRSVGEVANGNGFDPQQRSSNNGIAYDHYIDHVLTPSLADVLKQGEAPITEYSCFIPPPPEHALPPPSLNNSVDVVPTFPSLCERNEDVIIAQPRVVVPTKSRWPAPASSNEASVVDPGTSIATTITLAFDNSQPRSSSFSSGTVTTTVGLLDTKVNGNSRFPALIGDPAVIRPDELELADSSQIVMAKNGSNGKQLIGVKPMSALHVNGNHANSHQHQFAQSSCLLQDDKRAASNAPLFRRYKSSSVSDSGIEASNNFRNGTDAIRQGVPEFYSSPNPADARHHSFSHQFHQSKLSDRNDHIANLYRELNSSDHHSVPLLQHADVNNSKIEAPQAKVSMLMATPESKRFMVNVAKFPYFTTEKEIFDLFKKYGARSVYMKNTLDRNKQTLACVFFATCEEAERAQREMSNCVFKGHQLKANLGQNTRQLVAQQMAEKMKQAGGGARRMHDNCTEPIR